MVTFSVSAAPFIPVEDLFTGQARAYLSDLGVAAQRARHEFDVAVLAERDHLLLVPQRHYDPVPFDFDSAGSPTLWLAQQMHVQARARVLEARETLVRLAAWYVKAALHAVVELRARRRVSAQDLERASADRLVCDGGERDASTVLWRAELRPALPALVEIEPAPGWNGEDLRELYEQIVSAYADAAAAADSLDATRCERSGDDVIEVGHDTNDNECLETIAHLLLRFGAILVRCAQSWATVHREDDQRRVNRAAGRCVACPLCEGCTTGPNHRCDTNPCLCDTDEDAPADSADELPPRPPPAAAGKGSG